jgi:hypothetical protein
MKQRRHWHAFPVAAMEDCATFLAHIGGGLFHGGDFGFLLTNWL